MKAIPCKAVEATKPRRGNRRIKLNIKTVRVGGKSKFSREEIYGDDGR